MSGVKFYVWGGGRWREVSPSGRVAGWGCARFVAAAGGRLARCRRSAVLRGLRALAAGKPTTVHDGPPLPLIRPQLEEAPAVGCERCPGCPPPARRASGCTVHLNTDGLLARLLGTAGAPGPPRAATADAGVQASAGERPDRSELPHGDRQSHSKGKKERVDKNQNYERALAPKRPAIETKTSPTDYAPGRRRRSASGARAGADTETDDGEVCKELVIGEEDVALLRGFLRRHRDAPFPVDLRRFDEDDEYKRRVFFRLNPIVNLARSRRVERMLRARRSRTREARPVSLKDFAGVLGLQSVEERTSRDPNCSRARTDSPRKRTRADRSGRLALNADTSDTDKENAGGAARARRTTDARASDATGEASWRAERTLRSKEIKTDNENDRRAPARPLRKRAPPPGEPRKGAAREYSALEDAAIVRWVSGGQRARLVNGNRLWRKLQPLHHQLTGRFRSWHSLRNRYLRSLLPRLALHVPAADATRLRAAAATGELKSRRSRRNSIFSEARVRSAWSSRRRCPPPGAHSSSSSSELSLPSSDSGKRSRTPRRTRSSTGHCTAEAHRALRSSEATSPPRALRSGAAPRTPTYSELTRRFASRAASPARPATPAPRPRGRRLYNPRRAD